MQDGILQYQVTRSSSTDELSVLCRLLAEMGGYASTVLDREHAVFSRRCAALQAKAEKELLRRHAVSDVDEIYRVPEEEIDSTDLSKLTIEQLETLYRRHPARVDVRLSEGREIFTRYFETRIVRELERRKADTAVDSLRKEYCLRTNRDELDNISVLLRKPLGEDLGDTDPNIAPETLFLTIDKLSHFTTVAERERLVESVDMAINAIKAAPEVAVSANLAAQLVELSAKSIVRCPAWVNDILKKTIARWKKTPEANEAAMVFPLLTHALYNDAPSAERKAITLINRCYRRCLESTASDADLYVVSACRDYVTRFNAARLGTDINVKY